MWPLRKLAARMNLCPSTTTIVAPLYTAPSFLFGFSELSTLMTAVERLTPGFQPCTVPSSVTNRKIACLPGVVPAAGARRKSVALPLNIMPVGEPGAGWLGALGTITAPVGVGKAMIAPAPVYRVEVPLALFETHHGLVGP